MNPKATNYVTVDLNRMRGDILTSCRNKGLVMSKQLLLNGISDSLFSNDKNTYLRNKAFIDKICITENVSQPGHMQKSYYEQVLVLFDLKDTYRLSMKGEKVVASTVVAPSNAEIVEQLKQMDTSIRMIGNVLMQILEKMPAKTIERPIAKLPEKK